MWTGKGQVLINERGREKANKKGLSFIETRGQEDKRRSYDDKRRI